MSKYNAELIGTFFLTLVVGLSQISSFSLPTPVLAAITLMLMVYLLGPISGAHINPAITLGLLIAGKIKRNEAVNYIASQIIGASIALVLITLISRSLSDTMKFITPQSLQVGVAEVIGTLFFSFVVISVVNGKVSPGLTGFVIGSGLLIGIAIASMLGSDGILNPAVAFGIKSLSSMYLLGPLLGAFLGAKLYKKLFN